MYICCAISPYKIEHTAHYKYLYIHTINPENTVLAITTHNYAQEHTSHTYTYTHRHYRHDRHDHHHPPSS